MSQKRQRHTFTATQITRQGGNAIAGLAVPFGVKASENHPAFEPGMLLNGGQALLLPLIIDHDHRYRVGTVHKLWEASDGVRFIATLDDYLEELPSQLSIGATVYYENGAPVALHIDEISLTDFPAYKQTRYSFVANQKNPNNMETKTKLEEIKARMLAMRDKKAAPADVQKVTAQSLEEVMAIISELMAKYDNLAEQQAALAERVTVIEEKVNAAVDATAQITDVAACAMNEVEAKMQASSKEVAEALGRYDIKMSEFMEVFNKGLNAMKDIMEKVSAVKPANQ